MARTAGICTCVKAALGWKNKDLEQGILSAIVLLGALEKIGELLDCANTELCVAGLQVRWHHPAHQPNIYSNDCANAYICKAWSFCANEPLMI